ncbi:MAG: sensor histidine kinase [Microbacteriaceae bacterium]|nr:sensor histidine kinase [Microbacteriaceae bacterium]
MALALQNRLDAISLRTKITAVTVLLLTLGLLVSGIGTMAMLKPALIGQLDSEISAVAVDLTRLLDDSSATTGNSTSPSDYYYALYSADGTLLARNWGEKSSALLPRMSSTWSPQDTSVANGNVFVLKSGDGRTTFHAVAAPVVFQDFSGLTGSLVVAASTMSVDRLMATYLSIFLGFGIGVVIVGALLTRFLVTTTFAPLREVEQTAAAIADGDFSQRLQGATPNTEVGRLNRALNIMLGRIDRAFADRNRALSQMQRFIGDASHELRTPLVSVRGYAELYRMGALPKKSDIAQAMDRIEKEAIRMGVLVEDLLALARLDESRPLEITDVNLVTLAHDAAMDARAVDPDRQIDVIIPGDAGATSELTIQASEDKIRQVMTNLLGNAIRFTPTNTPLEIRLSSTRDESPQFATISIVDHGDGIAPQIRQKIFERFWRADSSRTRETGGSGLGLAIVASIVDAHRGSIDVSETPGGGATFSVTLPVVHPRET